MLEDPSNSQKQPLILPAGPTEEYHAPEYLVPTEQLHFQAGRLINRNRGSGTRPAGSLSSKLVRLWHRDPAYKVLFIAIGVVLASSVVCVALLAEFLTPLSLTPVTYLPSRPQPTPTFVPLSTSQATTPPTPVPTPIATPAPTQTPVIVVSPMPAATAPITIVPTPDPNQKLTVQLGALPAQINNNVMVPVTVTTNQPGATASLFVTYNAIPILYSSDPQTTDANGSTTFSWSVHERTFSPFTRMIVANITAVVHYQGRQQATSQTVTVHILTK